jgi:hypothetical protein
VPSRKFDPDDLHPSLREGYTQGQSAEEVAAEINSKPSGVELLRHMRDAETVEGTRVPLPKFVAEDDVDSVWTDGTDRLQRSAVLTFQPETFKAMQAGHICLRCLEPHQHAFPELCSLCSYPMKERQIADLALEFEGSKHLGPAKPLSEYAQEKEAARERRRFDKKLREGGSPMKGLRGS